MKQAKILLLSLMALATLFAGGCQNDASLESASLNPSEPSAPSPTKAVLQITQAPASASVAFCVSADFASDELLSQYASYKDYNEPEALSDQVKVVFMTSLPVKAFQFLKGGYVGGEEDSFRFVVNSVLYSTDELLPETPLVIGTVFEGDFPTRGFSFVDESNTTRFFTLGISGKDGSLVLLEY